MRNALTSGAILSFLSGEETGLAEDFALLSTIVNHLISSMLFVLLLFFDDAIDGAMEDKKHSFI